MAGQHGTKEINEVIDGAVEAIKMGVKVVEIVKMDSTSEKFSAAFALLKDQAENVDLYKNMIKDAELSIDEIKELDKEELIALIMKLANAVSEVKTAIKSLKKDEEKQLEA